MTEPQAETERQPAAPDPSPAPASQGGASLLVSSDAIVPDWLANLAALGWRVLVIAAMTVVALLVAGQLFVITASIAVAVVISAFFAPYALRLRQRGHSRAVSAAIVWAGALVVVSLAFLLLAFALVPHIVEVVSLLLGAIDKVRTDVAALGLPPAVPAVIGDLLHAALSSITSGAGDTGSQIAAQAASAVTIIVLAAFLVFFFLKDGDKAWVWIFQAASDSKRERITEAGDDALWRVGGYLRGTTYLSAIIAVTDYVFMFILGIPLAGPLALLAFLSGYIPYFGGAVATLFILGVAFVAVGPGAVVAMLVLIGIRNMILGYGIRPTIYGKSVSIHPALVLLALPVGFELAGVVGLFAAVPVTAIVLAVASATVAILDPGPRPGLPALVPAWIDRLAQWAWRLLVGVALIALCVLVVITLPLLVIPVIIALILAATLDPLMHRLIRGGRGRGQSAAIAVGGSFLVVLLVMTVTVVSLVTQIGELSSTVSRGAESANTAAGGVLGLLQRAVMDGGRVTVDTVVSTASTIGQVLVILLLSVLLTFYFLKDGNNLWGMALSKVRNDARGEIDAVGSRAFTVLGGYMIGTGAISLVGAASQLFIMVVLGIPLALPVFVLSFFLCFIPYIGGFISTGIAFLLTVAVGSPTDIAIMAVWTVVFNIVTGNIVTPLVYGRMVSLHPAVVLVAIPAGAAVAGILGMFIVVPVIAIVAVSWRSLLAVIGMRRRAGSPPSTPAAQVSPTAVLDGTAPEPA
jgi:predicted PurR-regulated permease PerM